MKIGLLLPSALMYAPLSEGKIFAPKGLFIDLINGLSARGHRLRVYAPLDAGVKQSDVCLGNIELLKQESYAMKYRYTEQHIRSSIAKNQARWEYELDVTAQAYNDATAGDIEIVHSFLEFSSHYFAKATGVPSVFTVHDPLPEEKYLDYWRYRMFPKDNYVAVSQSQAKKLAQIVNIAGIVYNGVNPSKFSINNQEGKYLLFVGRYMPEKGVEDAVRTGIATQTQIILVGSKEYKRLPYFRQIIQPYEASGYMKDMGFMKSKQKNCVFGGAKALLFPISWEEPFGLVMIEAMACGTPVIAYNRGSVPEVVKDGVTGFIIDPDDEDRPGKGSWVIKKQGIDGLVEAVRRIGEIDRTACRKHVEENFTVNKMVDGYERVYKKILTG